MAVAGWTGMRLVTFLILDAIGSLAWAGMLAGLGYALGHRAVICGTGSLQVWTVGHNRASSFLWCSAQMRGVRTQR